MKFVNKGPDRRITIGESENRRRIGLKTGQEIDLPSDVGRKFELDEVTKSIQKVTKGKIGKTKVETKQFDNKKYVSFWNELLKIKGIGLNTAKDIVKIFKSKKELIKAIKSKEHLPFRDDVVKKLKKKRW